MTSLAFLELLKSYSSQVILSCSWKWNHKEYELSKKTNLICRSICSCCFLYPLRLQIKFARGIRHLGIVTWQQRTQQNMAPFLLEPWATQPSRPRLPPLHPRHIANNGERLLGLIVASPPFFTRHKFIGKMQRIGGGGELIVWGFQVLEILSVKFATKIR